MKALKYGLFSLKYRLHGGYFGRFYKKYKKDQDVRVNAAEALGELGNQRAVKRLFQDPKKSKEGSTSTEVLATTMEDACIKALGKIGGNRATEYLVNLLEGGLYTGQHEVVFDALGTIGNEKAIDTLLLHFTSLHHWHDHAASGLKKYRESEKYDGELFREKIITTCISKINFNSSFIYSFEILDAFADKRDITIIQELQKPAEEAYQRQKKRYETSSPSDADSVSLLFL